MKFQLVVKIPYAPNVGHYPVGQSAEQIRKAEEDAFNEEPDTIDFMLERVFTARVEILEGD